MDLDLQLQVPFLEPLNASDVLPMLNSSAPVIAEPVHHILSGSFRSLSLFLLAFAPLQRTLTLVQTIPASGPHQYIALGPRLPPSEGREVRAAYTTSWALPPTLQSWAIETTEHGTPRVRLVDSVDISATSSYIAVPPPFTHAYAAGGPAAQVLALPAGGAPGFGGVRKASAQQEVRFVRDADWEAADKTRKALRYGSHGIEFAVPPAGSDATALAFVPVLGGSTIEIYTRGADGSLTHIDTSPAPVRPGTNNAGTTTDHDGADERRDKEDGPRHVKVHPNGRVLYCVTEHSNFLDVYTITPPPVDGPPTVPVLTYVASRSLLPPSVRETAADVHAFRGDTLILAPGEPETIFVSTRGAEGAFRSSTRGWVSAFRLAPDGQLFGATTPSTNPYEGENNPYLVERFAAPTGGGKAHALDVRAKDGAAGEMWVVLTDDDASVVLDETHKGAPGVRVLEWDGWLWRGGGTRLREVVAWPPAGLYADAPEGDPERMQGGSHAVWLD
ncbi:hypothetical protein B0H15DRAFT_952938 [Mycena belliarum]|uniref:Muconate cycloisomerase 1 n=1 Tax=Mycena belliarum TaxID=1033014 RepID=A0AAD6TVZ5_9AGAR|nr:hypothetical protein B0H15DRAFT_952938 [Mycena belliae]